MAKWLNEGSSIAGLLLGAFAWAANFQLSYALTPRSCGASTALLWIVAGLALALCLVGAFVSGRAWRRTPQLAGIDSSSAAQPRRAVAAISLGATALFGAAILLQAIAGFFLNGCWR